MISRDQNAHFFLGPEETDTACLLIHGFSGSPAELYELGEALASKNIRVHGLCLPGHGNNADQLIETGRKQWLAAAEEGLTSLSSYPNIFLAGLSMGGVLALLLAERHPDNIVGTIVMSTPTRIKGGWQLKVLPLARYFVKWFYPLQFLNFRDPKIQEKTLHQARLRDPAITIDFSDPAAIAHIKQMIRVPVPAIDELVRLTALARKRLSRVRTPLCIIQSKQDQTVLPVCAEEIYQLATEAQPKSLHWLERSDHVITMGPEKEEVFKLCEAFIASTIKDAAAKTVLLQDVHQHGADGTFPDR